MTPYFTTVFEAGTFRGPTHFFGYKFCGKTNDYKTYKLEYQQNGYTHVTYGGTLVTSMGGGLSCFKRNAAPQATVLNGNKWPKG